VPTPPSNIVLITFSQELRHGLPHSLQDRDRWPPADLTTLPFSGDNWNGIMKDTLREECDSSEECLRNCCVNPYFAPLFFVVFVLMAQFVLVNVVVAVLMKHLEESHKQVGAAAPLKLCARVTVRRHVCILQCMDRMPRPTRMQHGAAAQVKFEDLFLVQCFKLCALATNERMTRVLGKDTSRKQRRIKAELTHKIETYFD
jgi:hypothetical protein